MKCKYEGTGIWNGRCIGTKEVDPCPGYDKCKQYKPNYTTNADRIRAMSDEELAELLLDGCCGSKCDDQPQNEFGSVNCFQCRIKWLKQRAKGE